jgi:hypothetical protein
MCQKRKQVEILLLMIIQVKIEKRMVQTTNLPIDLTKRPTGPTSFQCDPRGSGSGPKKYCQRYPRAYQCGSKSIFPPQKLPRYKVKF